MCPYEISIGVAKKSKVIVTDYYYMFHPKISASFLKKIGKEIEDIIIIVDEAHGLPERVKNLATENLSSVSVLRGIQEAKKLGFENVIEYLNGIQDVLLDLSKGMTVGEEKLIKKEDFTAELKIKFDYEQMSSDIHFVSDSMKEMQKKSYLGSIAKFLDLWTGQDDGFARILTLKKGFRGPFVSLSYRCLDPSVLTKKVIDDSYSSIFMSGTLLPTHMYKELLGVDNSREVVFSNPFPKNNKLNLVIPKTTTKYSKRSDEQYNNISKICEEITDAVPGNSVIFFPSYFILDQVKKYFTTRCQKTVFTEIPKMLKAEKQDLLERFKGYKEIGAVLLAVTSGSFSEGIDLPGDLLKCVVVVGLPLSPPNLEIKSLINYYDMKYGKGWDYGYLFPAFNKTLQSAGRCIRSETDRGVIVFLDERYAWKNYSRCFPEDWVMETTLDYKEKIDEFFNI